MGRVSLNGVLDDTHHDGNEGALSKQLVKGNGFQAFCAMHINFMTMMMGTVVLSVNGMIEYLIALSKQEQFTLFAGFEARTYQIDSVV